LHHACELEEEEAEVEKLERWLEQINVRDLHSAPGRTTAEGAVKAAQAALGRYTDAVFTHSQP
jgi:hypothetical protein